MAVVPATYEASSTGGEVLRCRVPSADAAGFRTSLTIRFDEPPRLSELGSLHGQAALRGGALRLVPRAVPSGTPYPYSGALLLRVLPGAPPLPFWRVRFDVMMHGASSALGGGGGISFNYGLIGDGARLDVSGSGHSGLSVSVRTGHALVLEVRLSGDLLLATSLGHALRDDV